MKTKFIFGFVLTLPIFLMFSHGIQLSPEFSATLRSDKSVLPVSTIILFFCTLYYVAVLSLRIRRLALFPEDVFLGAYMLCLTVSFIVGILDQTIRPYAIGLSHYLIGFLQGAMPAAAYIVARMVVMDGGIGGTIESRTKDLYYFFLGTLFCSILTFIGYGIQTVISGPSLVQFTILADHIGPFYNYQIQRFYGLYLVATSVFLICFYIYGRAGSTARFIAMIGAGLSMIGTALLWSRTAMVGGALGLIIACCFAFGRGRSTAQTGRLIVLFTVIVTSLVLLVTVVGEATGKSISRLIDVANKITDSTAKLSQGDQQRFQSMLKGLTEGLLSPFGTEFRSTGHGLLVSENGYLDFAVRGGPLATLSAFFLFMTAMTAAWRLVRASRTNPNLRPYAWMYIGLFVNITVFIFWINIWLNAGTEPYVAPFYWALASVTLTQARLFTGVPVGHIAPPAYELKNA